MNDPQMPTASADPSATTAADAQRLLAEASSRSDAVPTALPAVFLTYTVLCVAGSFSALAMHLLQHVPESAAINPDLYLAVLVVGWVMAALVPILVFRRDRWRRGMTARWLLMMLGWGLLWALTMVFASSLAVLFIAPLFIALFVIAVAQQAQANKVQRIEAGAER